MNDEDKTAAFYHPIKKQLYTGTIIGREMAQGINMFKLSYVDGNQKLVAYVSPKNVIKFEN
jgi:hypothetical protein